MVVILRCKKRLDQIQAETLSRITFLLMAEEFLQMAYDRELADATMRKKTGTCTRWLLRCTEPPHQNFNLP